MHPPREKTAQRAPSDAAETVWHGAVGARRSRRQASAAERPRPRRSELTAAAGRLRLTCRVRARAHASCRAYSLQRQTTFLHALARAGRRTQAKRPARSSDRPCLLGVLARYRRIPHDARTRAMSARRRGVERRDGQDDRLPVLRPAEPCGTPVGHASAGSLNHGRRIDVPDVQCEGPLMHLAHRKIPLGAAHSVVCSRGLSVEARPSPERRHRSRGQPPVGSAMRLGE